MLRSLFCQVQVYIEDSKLIFLRYLVIYLSQSIYVPLLSRNIRYQFLWCNFSSLVITTMPSLNMLICGIFTNNVLLVMVTFLFIVTLYFWSAFRNSATITLRRWYSFCYIQKIILPQDFPIFCLVCTVSLSWFSKMAGWHPQLIVFTSIPLQLK